MLTPMVGLPTTGEGVSVMHFEVYVRKLRYAEACYAASGHTVSIPVDELDTNVNARIEYHVHDGS
jgi:hypothetical protein